MGKRQARQQYSRNVHGQGHGQRAIVNSRQSVSSGKTVAEGDLFAPTGAPTENKPQLALGSAYPSLGSINTDDCPSVVPAAGNRNGSSLNNAGSNGNYWSGTLNASNSNNAYNLNFNSGNVNRNNNNRYNGHTVRPVTEFTTEGLPPHPFRLSKEQLLADLVRAYYDARRHKRRKPDQILFEVEMEKELSDLRDEIWERRYVPSPSKCFIIKKPKVREIFAAAFRDRVVHHLVYNYIGEMLDRTFIADSYSCRKGKGTHYGIHRLQHHIRSCSGNYARRCFVLKMDIQGYFMAIDREMLDGLVRKAVMGMGTHPSPVTGKRWMEVVDYDLVLYLCHVIISHDPIEACVRRGRISDWDIVPPRRSLFKARKGCGLPIGNLTSQLFSNVYLNGFDHFMKSQCGCRHYGRYVDDFYVVSNHWNSLRDIKEKAGQYLEEERHLHVNPQKTVLRNVAYGIDFLGAYLKPYRLYIRNSTLQRASRNVADLHRLASVLPGEAIRDVLNSYLGMMCKHMTFHYRMRHVFTEVAWIPHGTFNADCSKFIPRKRKLPIIS
ncbi:MAG: group II intron reverse transcriptase domain-containing protein [Prevotella sp.]|nr:group II intron reverse transcriptase domain-containing protein [Prevotella sp.]